MKCFFAVLKMEARASSLYRVDFLLKLCYALIAMYGARCLWIALYAQDSNIAERSLPSMITYAMLAMALDMIFYPSILDSAPQKYIAKQVREGRIDTDLLRPIHLQSQVFMRNACSAIFSMLAIVLPAWLVAVAFFGMQLPPSPLYGFSFLASCVCSFVLLFALNFMLGMVSFVTTDIRQITMAYSGVITILSGKIIPIWLFPDSVQAVIKILPFRCIFETPLNIYTGIYNHEGILMNILLQVVWAIGLLLVGRAMWYQVHKRLTVQGG